MGIEPHARTFSYSYLKLTFFMRFVCTNVAIQIHQTLSAVHCFKLLNATE